MADLLDLILDTFPANGDVGVPLASNLTFTLSGLDYDETSLTEGFFVEGPDTDQFVGPGLIELTDNVSQGDLDDFLGSAGYAGIIQGTVTVSGIGGNTVITFNPEIPMAPEVTYVANLSNVLDASEVEITGFVSFSFDTGTGSIEVIPATVSTSILSAAVPESVVAAALEDLEIVSITPADRSIQNPTTLDEIVVTFNKPINAASVVASEVSVKTIPATDHPDASTQSIGELAKTIEVNGAELKLKI